LTLFLLFFICGVGGEDSLLQLPVCRVLVCFPYFSALRFPRYIDVSHAPLPPPIFNIFFDALLGCFFFSTAPIQLVSRPSLISPCVPFFFAGKPVHPPSRGGRFLGFFFDRSGGFACLHFLHAFFLASCRKVCDFPCSAWPFAFLFFRIYRSMMVSEPGLRLIPDCLVSRLIWILWVERVSFGPVL